MNPFAHKSTLVIHRRLKTQFAAIHIHQFGFTPHLHAQWGRGKVFYLQQCANCALSFFKTGGNAPPCGLLNQGNHGRSGKHVECAALHLFRREFFFNDKFNAILYSFLHNQYIYVCKFSNSFRDYGILLIKIL